MNDGYINTVDGLLKSIPNFPSEDMKISSSSSKLLRKIYEKAVNLPKDVLNEPLKPPLIISFHPKMSLLNNNVHETYLAEKVAKKLGMVPIWIPYIYDTGYKTAANKIRLPSYVYFEGKYLSLRASAKIRGNIMATEKPIADKEVKNFFRELTKHENSTLTRFKNLLNPINFGHHLFDLKRDSSPISGKTIRKKAEEFEKSWLRAIKGTKKLSDSLANISIDTLKKFGINVGLMMIDEILGEIVETVFREVLETSSVKKDPSLLENLFLSYDLKTKERSPILYTGDGQFIAFDEYDVKVFEGNLNDLVSGIVEHTILPTGNLIMTLFTAMGCKLVLGGEHTIEYYPDYFKIAYSLLRETSFNSKMMLFSYGKIDFMDLRNMTDIMSVVRVLDKVGSRNYIQKGFLTLPNDIVDHLHFLKGPNAVPVEYSKILDEIKPKTKKSESSESKVSKSDEKDSKKNIESGDDIDVQISIYACEKEQNRCTEIQKVCEKAPEQLLEDPSALKKWIKGTHFDGMHPIRLEVLLENLRLDADMRLKKLEENVEFEQHILGGTLGTEEDKTIIYDGILQRSNRYPSLFEMVYYRAKPMKEFVVGGKLKEHESDWIWKHFVHEQPPKSKKARKYTGKFTEYKDTFEYLIPPEIRIKFKN